MPKRVPISAANSIATEHTLNQVILLAWDGDLTHVVTYGKTVEDCDQAALAGDRIKAALGWPETANALPSRVKAQKDQIAALKRENEFLRTTSNYNREQAETAERQLAEFKQEAAEVVGPFADWNVLEPYEDTSFVDCVFRAGVLRRARAFLDTLQTKDDTHA